MRAVDISRLDRDLNFSIGFAGGGEGLGSGNLDPYFGATFHRENTILHLNYMYKRCLSIRETAIQIQSFKARW